MTLTELLRHFRTDIDDFGDVRGKGVLVSDCDATRFLNEAEDEAAMRKRLIYDDTQTVTITAPGISYALTPTLQKFFEFTKADLYRWVGAGPLYSPKRLSLFITDQPWVDSNYPDWDTDTSDPQYLIVEDLRFVLPNKMTRDYLLRVAGYRTPLAPMSDAADPDTQAPEIAARHHRMLVDWAIYRAYSKPDAEIYNPKKAADALAAFEAYFGYRLQATTARDSQINRPNRVQAIW